MDLKQLEYFVRVAEMGSFTRASISLDVAQPALSRQIRLLEVELRGRAVVILDDMASTGQTVAQAARLARAAGAASVDVAVTHALFVEGAEQAEHMPEALLRRL